MRKFWWDLTLGVLATVVVSLAAKAGHRWDAVSDKYGPVYPVFLVALCAAAMAVILWTMSDFLPKRGERGSIGDWILVCLYGIAALGCLGAVYAVWFDAMKTAWILLGVMAAPVVLPVVLSLLLGSEEKR